MFAQQAPVSGYVPSRSGPGSFGIAVGINVALIGALLYAGPGIEFTPKKPPIPTFDVPLEPPPPEPPKPIERAMPRSEPSPPQPVDTTESLVERPVDDFVVPVLPPMPLNPGPLAGEGMGSGTGIAVDPPKPAPPIMVQPGVDPRYLSEFQPTYPAEERRAGRDGRVVVRALVGVDGRVKQLERVTATSDAFWRTTLDRALRHWRFTPGTRDGIPVEAWRTMTLTFRMQD
ncbi:MAG TPA: TonB family protein [Sphingomonas sp.]|jgi:protein TonB